MSGITERVGMGSWQEEVQGQRKAITKARSPAKYSAGRAGRPA